MLKTVRERVDDPNIFRVYWATLALGTAYGLAISVLAPYLDQRGFSKTAIGELAAWFAAGIVALSLPMGWLIRRFSAKATLAVSLVGYAITVGVFPLLDSFWAIAGVRFFDGACSVGVWVSSETILLCRARREHKAFVTSIYALAIAVGYLLGPFVAWVIAAFIPLRLSFEISSALALLTGLYVAVRMDASASDERPEAHEATVAIEKTPALTLLWRIKNSCFATFAYGYFQASVVLFLPLYLKAAKGVSERNTLIIPAFFAGGMLLFLTYVGRRGDRLGHLGVMRELGIIGLSMILCFVFLDSYPLMCAAVFFAGASLGCMSPVSLALQGLISSEYSRATAIYNSFYAAGMLLGPPISSRIFDARGGALMLYHLAALWTVFVLLTILFYRDDPAILRRKLAAQQASVPDSVPVP
jgi:MFS family permease